MGKFWIAPLLVFVGAMSACEESAAPRPSSNSGIRFNEILSSTLPGNFTRVYRGRRFTFPIDHVAHSEYKSERWSFSGNVQTDSGRRFGYQLTIFRVGLAGENTNSINRKNFARTQDETKSKKSRWRAKNYYIAQFSVSDVLTKRYLAFERIQRNSLGLAGALRKGENSKGGSNGVRIWVDDWNVDSISESFLPLRISVELNKVSIKLHLDELKSIVLNGNEGLFQMGRKPGNASYYYSMPRLDTTGTVVIKGETFRVSGVSWLDHEWSTSILEPGLVGADLFTLQLDDGRELMFSNLRREDDSKDSNSMGNLVHKDGSYETILSREVEISIDDYWQSPQSGINYPAAWTIKLLRHEFELTVTPVFPDQELDFSIKSWKGLVDVTGRNLNGDQTAIIGHGYVSLNGYR
ncbi:MAG: lipocalin-like domain-containing protein [Thiohalomonadales bacterium]